MFKISPIGSCRITGPLRHGQGTHGIALNLGRCYGYCHSPAEAIQLARFMRGEADIPGDIWPLVSPSRAQNTFSEEVHEPSDLYVIELASAKELTIDGVCVQLNYLSSTYREFFSDPARAQEFWERAEMGDADAIGDYLDREWSADPQRRAEAGMLSRLRLRHVTRESLRRDIATLADLLPEVMFVTHVDARKPDGARIGSRSAFIRLVDDEVGRAGLRCFNPTRLMDEFGQTDAIEDHSTSLAHFTVPFTHAIMDTWMREVIAPMTDAALADAPGHGSMAALEPQIAAAHGRGAHLEAQERLEKLVQVTGSVAEMLEESGRKLRAARSAFKRRLADLATGTVPAGDIGHLVEEAAALGHIELARGLADTATGGASGLPAAILMNTARRAAETGASQDAFAFAYAAYRRDPGSAPARALLANLALAGPLSACAQIDPADLRHILADLNPKHRMPVLEVQGIPFAAAISPETPEAELADMSEHLFERERLDEAADLMSDWRAITATDRLRDPGLTAMLDAWVEAACELPEPLGRLVNLAKIRTAEPNHPELRKALRSHKLDLVRRIRAAGKALDGPALEELCHEVNLFPDPLPEFDLWRARLQFDRGDFGEAIERGLAAAEHMPGVISIWVLLMRAAEKSRNGPEAAEFARNVVELACDRTAKFRMEAEAVLDARRASA